MLNLDTHILIHALAGSLNRSEMGLLSNAPWGISAIVLWELAKLRQRGRIELDLESRRFQDVLRQLHVWPLDWKVALASTQLDFDGDPADSIIAATSVVHGVELVTRDKAIRRSKLVSIAR